MIDGDMVYIRAAAARLAEHFDCVQIFASRVEDNNRETIHYDYGLGNWFARYGQIRHFIGAVDNMRKIEYGNTIDTRQEPQQ